MPVPDKSDTGLPGYDLALKTAAEAFSLLGRFSAPPIPKAYEICYAYATGQPVECVNRVDDAVARDGMLSLHEVYEIHGELFSYPDKVRQQQKETTENLDAELDVVLAKVAAHLSASNAYGNSLDSAADGLRGTVSLSELKPLIQRLLLENRRARERAQDLSQSLEASRTSIREMRAKLAKAQEAGLRDPLTKLYNRRYMDEVMPMTIALAQDQKSPLCIVLADIDHFKAVNDTFGHPAGDAVLRIVGAIMAENVKGKDIAVRYGGEEFALILPDTGTAGAFSLSNRLRGTLEQKRLILRDKSVSMGRVTASFGVAELRSGESGDALIARADMMLYEAKRTGRNKVVCDGEDDEKKA